MLKTISPQDVRAFFMNENRMHAFTPELELRESGSGDGSRILTGYAAVYNQETTLYKGKSWMLKEKIAPGAFDSVLARNPDVHLMSLVHIPDGAPIARTTKRSGYGSLQLSSDDHGLRVYAKLNPNDIDVQRLITKMEDGLVDQMSFAFTVAKDKIETIVDEDGYETDIRTIIEIDELYDVTVLAQGAYSQTEAVLRSMLFSQGATVANREILGDSSIGATGLNPAVIEKNSDKEALIDRKSLLILQAQAKEIKQIWRYKK